MTRTTLLFTVMVFLGVCSFTAIANTKLSKSQEIQLFYNVFKDWISRYNRQYGIEELAVRFMSWKENYDYIQEYNSRNTDSRLEMNDFSDLNSEEFSALHLGLNVDFNALKNKKNGLNFTLEDTDDSVTNNTTNGTKLLGKAVFTAPKSVDWRKANAVTPVKNQGSCGACYSFAAAGALEGLRAIKNKKLENLSVQQTVDCSSNYGNNGCDGGLMTYSFQYTQDYGVQTEADYGYKGEVSECKYNSKKVVFKNNGYAEVPSNNFNALKAAVARQPVTVGIEAANKAVQLFKNGTISVNCTTKLDHAVLIVGYNTTAKGEDYWIVKNSWGDKWGQEGYFNIAMGNQNDGAGVCGINMMASYPTLNRRLW